MPNLANQDWLYQNGRDLTIDRQGVPFCVWCISYSACGKFPLDRVQNATVFTLCGNVRVKFHSIFHMPLIKNGSHQNIHIILYIYCINPHLNKLNPSSWNSPKQTSTSTDSTHLFNDWIPNNNPPDLSYMKSTFLLYHHVHNMFPPLKGIWPITMKVSKCFSISHKGLRVYVRSSTIISHTGLWMYYIPWPRIQFGC